MQGKGLGRNGQGDVVPVSERLSNQSYGGRKRRGLVETTSKDEVLQDNRRVNLLPGPKPAPETPSEELSAGASETHFPCEDDRALLS